MNEDLKISLVYYNSPDLGEQWLDFFQNEDNVEVIEGDIFEIRADAIVSPGNSLGYRDGGLDLLISKKIGWEIQTKLKKHIPSTDLKELLVGQAISIESEMVIVICAPTMRVPTSEGIPNSVNAYLAMKAILIEASKNTRVNSIAIPGLCTETARMPAYVAAKQMKAAYDEVINGIQPEFPLYLDALKYHNNLKRNKN
ncbi:MAG TPA: Appr-1-p processing protein [Cytophagales bacterium]|nr:Appr-1-p processing protein [Cytophagales bacterium]HAA23874.1 Appr-1-p processing protein [Cytophagales bacterium]HAP64026.1 Appr-1-p processing protein [Cytophagales bacterium]